MNFTISKPLPPIEPEDKGPPPPTPEEDIVSKVYGQSAFLKVVRGEVVIEDINEAYWAGLYAHENIVLHEPSERAFYRYAHDSGLYAPETADKIKCDISSRLLESSTEPLMGQLIKFRKDTKLNSIVAALRGITEERDAFANRPQAVHLKNCVLCGRRFGSPIDRAT